MKKTPRFLLAGNSSYQNRGSEAIVRGTTAILRRSFGSDVQFALAQFGEKRDIETQSAAESDPAISHILLSYKRFSTVWLRDQLDRRLAMNTHGRHCMLRREVGDVCASLQVGGDNYSLDYGRPYMYFGLDDYLIRQHVPVFLWGASVGPFDSDPEFADFAHDHMNKLSGILVRETRSLEYLRRNGVSERARLVADPAFAMPPEMPSSQHMPSVDLKRNPIGLNFSPLMARYVTGGDMNLWATMCAQTVVSIMKTSGENILLVPHVFAPQNDDGTFLADVAERVKREIGTAVCVTNRELSAAQIKWVISHCSVFIGARTHSTIAAFSSGVPTLSLAYSVKARGLNQDIFGGLDYCLDPQQATPQVIADRTRMLIADATRVREQLADRLPAITARAFAAGDILAEFLHERDMGHA